jgi:hypothetical protein
MIHTRAVIALVIPGRGNARIGMHGALLRFDEYSD